MKCFVYADESGNSGLKLFGDVQDIFWTGAVISFADLDQKYASFHRELLGIVGKPEPHGNELGFGRIEHIAGRLAWFIREKKLRFSFVRIFKPSAIKPGRYNFAVGTAGSGTLVLQTILPALMTANEPSYITIQGGTHNQAAPPFDFLAKTFLPQIERMGPRVLVNLEKYGFYPAGGGRFEVEIHTCSTLLPIYLDERGTTERPKVHAIVANLNRQIAQREIFVASHLLQLAEEEQKITFTNNSPGPGNVVMIEVESTALIEVFTSFGKMGVSAEKVGTDAASPVSAYLASETAVSEHLADQLLLPMALAGAGSFTTAAISSHAQTNMDVIKRFLPVSFLTEQAGRGIRIQIVREYAQP